MEKTLLTRTWPVQAPGARPGDVVRLVIPDPVHAAYRGYLNGLCLEAQGRQIGYELDSPREELPTVSLPGARPRPMDTGISGIEIPLPAAGLPLTTVHLRARPQTFHRQVQLLEGSRVVDERRWLCGSDLTIPCEIDLAAVDRPYRRPSRLSLRFLDGDNPPLPAVDVVVRRREEALLFIWPGVGPVHLLTGAHVGSQGGQDLSDRPTRPARIEGLAEDRNATAAFVLAGISLLALLGWRSWRLRTALALAALAALPGAVRADSGLLYTRPVEVPAQGLVRVPLDLATLRHLGANEEGLRVFGPAGEKIPAWIETEGAQDPETLWSPVGAPGGASFVISREQNLLGLVLSLGGSGSIAHLRAHLEGSEDQKAWRPLGDEDLFEIPPGRNGSFLYVLPYPVQDRFVRITIPDFNANVQNVSPAVSPVLSVPVDRLEPEDANGASYRLTLPARGQSPVWLHLDLAGPREAAVRVYAAEKGSWRLLVQGIRRASQPGSRFSIPILTKPLNGRELRIEIAGPGGGPRITGASLDLAQPVVAFRAGRPGRYELRYGDGRSYVGSNNDSPPDRSEPGPWIAPGPESARELPPLPPSAPAVPLDGRFAAAWPVQAAGARPGDVVRLEIPAGVYTRSRAFGEDVRLTVGDRQIPYVRQTADDPALVLSRRGLRPKPPLIGENLAYVLLPQPGLPLTTWQTTFGSQAGGASNVRMWFRFKEGSTYGMAYGKTDPLLPCRVEGDLAELSRKVGPRASELGMEAYSLVDLALWRRRDVLVFVWPREGPVVLRTGSNAGAARYDLELLAPDLLARPWRAATVGPQEPEIPLVRFLALLAGAGVALVLLGKALPGA